MALAHHRKSTITDTLLHEVLDIADDFKSDFAGGLVPHAEMGRMSDDEGEA